MLKRQLLLCFVYFFAHVEKIFATSFCEPVPLLCFFFFSEPIYHSSNVSDSSFYDSYDPFEYMTDQSERGDPGDEELLGAGAVGGSVDDPFEENQNLDSRSGGGAMSPGSSNMSTSQLSVYTPNRQNVKKVRWLLEF